MLWFASIIYHIIQWIEIPDMQALPTAIDLYGMFLV